MSVIVAIQKADQLVIASDTAQSDDGMTLSPDYYLNHEKIISWGNSWLGLVGWSCTQDIMESVIRELGSDVSLTSRGEIFDTFRQIHKMLKEDYFIETDEDKDQPVESSQLGALLVNHSGIYEIESYRTVTQYRRFWAIGSGKKLALGVMDTLYDENYDAVEIARRAVETACRLDESCSLPVDLKKLESAQ